MWQELLDATSGQQYFHNLITQETQWTKPAAAETDAWIERRLLMGSRGDQRRRRATPAHVEPEEPSVKEDFAPTTVDELFTAVSAGWPSIKFHTFEAWWSARAGPASAADADISTAREYFGNNALSREDFDVVMAEIALMTWDEHVDEASGRVYHANRDTRETMWTPPGQLEVEAWLASRLVGEHEA